MGVREGGFGWGAGGEGALAPWNLKKITSYVAFLRNTLKSSLAPSTLAVNTLPPNS